MTSLIEKIAFMPPRRTYAERVLKDRVGYVTSRLGHRVSYLDLLPSNPGRCIPAGGEGQPSNSSDPSRRYSGAPFSPLYTMLYAHGNAEDLAYGCRDLTFFANKLGIRIVPYDYPGYGLSEPIKPTEEAAEAAEEAMFEYLTNEVGIPRNRIILCGRSLGGGPSTWLASRQPGLAALILICTFTSCAAVAGKAASLVARTFDVFPSIRRIGKIKDFPILIVHGDNDTIVPYEHGKALYKEALSKNQTHVQMLTLPGCGHNNIEYHSGPTFWAGVRGFIESIVARRTSREAFARAGVEPPQTFTDAVRTTVTPQQQSQMHQNDRAQFRQYVSGRGAQQQQQAAGAPAASSAGQQQQPQIQQPRQPQPAHLSSLEQQVQEQQNVRTPVTTVSADVYNNPQLLMQHVLAQHHAALGAGGGADGRTTTSYTFANASGTGATSHLHAPSLTAATANFTSLSQTQRAQQVSATPSGYSSAAVNQPLQPTQQHQYHHQYQQQQYHQPMTPWEHGIAAPVVVDQTGAGVQQQYYMQSQQQQQQYAHTVPVQSYLQPGGGWQQSARQTQQQFFLDPATNTWQQR